jgi:predicted nucleic acid-binding protein
VSETIFLLDGDLQGVRHLLEMIRLGLLLSQHFLPEELSGVTHELTRYRRRRVDFADACLVTLSDRRPDLPLVTTDKRDFAVYLRGRTVRILHTP